MHLISRTLDFHQLNALSQHLKHSVYLKSNGNDIASGLDIFSAAPEKFAESFEDLIRQASKDQQTVEENKHFTSGWIGARGYDDDCFYAAYYSWAYVFDHAKAEGFLYFSKHCSTAKQSRILEIIDSVSSSENHANRDEQASASPTRFSELSWRPSQDKAKYEKSFVALQNYIRCGDCYQANLTQRFETTAAQPPTSLLSSFEQLSKNSNAAYCCYLSLADGHELLSVSPEQFIRVENMLITTKPIKGTVKASGPITDEQYQRLFNDKNRAENLMIVDLLRNDLGKVAETGSVSVPKLFELESFENVHHLVSTVSAKLRQGLSPLDAFDAAFPGGSITGAPKCRAMEIIEELEEYERRFYCGSIFYLDDSGLFDSNIMIRTLERIADALYCWAGGGIVADSEMESEYQESLDKVNHITGI